MTRLIPSLVFSSESDDEEENKAPVPGWAQTPNLNFALASQSNLNPERVFGKVQPLALEGEVVAVSMVSRDLTVVFFPRCVPEPCSSAQVPQTDELWQLGRSGPPHSRGRGRLRESNGFSVILILFLIARWHIETTKRPGMSELKNEGRVSSV